MHPSWYALHVRTGTEDDVARAVQGLGYDTCSPTRTMIERRGGRWAAVDRTMLQGYVLIRLDLSVKAYAQIRALQGVIRFLGATSPETVPDEQMRVMLTLGNDGTPLGPSKAHYEGSALVVDEGPLKGWETKITEVDARRKRAKVSITLLQEQVSVELAMETTGRQADPEGDPSPTEEAAE